MEVSYHNSFDRQHSYNLNKIIFFSISISVIFQSVSSLTPQSQSRCHGDLFLQKAIIDHQRKKYSNLKSDVNLLLRVSREC